MNATTRFDFDDSDENLRRIATTVVSERLRALGPCPEHGEFVIYEHSAEREGFVGCCQMWVNRALAELGVDSE